MRIVKRYPNSIRFFKSTNWISRGRFALSFCLCLLVFLYFYAVHHYEDHPLRTESRALLTLINDVNNTSSFSYPDACLAPVMDVDSILSELQEERRRQPHLSPIAESENAGKMFITNSQISFCSGLGNQMFRFASLYGLGRLLGRWPAYSVKSRCGKAEIFPGELKLLFPVQTALVPYIDLPLNQTEFVPKFAAKDCCHYDDPYKSNLAGVKAKNLVLSGAVYLQIFQYFHAWRDELRKIFRFSSSLCEQAMKQKNALFRNEPAKSHKFCVHTRRLDFQQRNWQSEKGPTETAIQFCIHHLRELLSGGQPVSLILLGDDKRFLHNLNVSNKDEPIHQVYILEEQNRDMDFALAVLSCDSLLISAPASTFAWWIGYLMRTPKAGRVFFIANFTGMDRNRRNFPADWIPIRLDQKSGKFFHPK